VPLPTSALAGGVLLAASGIAHRRR